MDVGVDQAGDRAAAGQVEDFGVGADHGFDVGVVAEGEDLLAEGGQGADAGLRGLLGEDWAAAHDQWRSPARRPACVRASASASSAAPAP